MRAVSMLAALATVVTLPLAAQQTDSSRSDTMRGPMHGRTDSTSMMAGGMSGGMMGGAMMSDGGAGMMGGGTRHGMGMDSGMMGSMSRDMAFMPQHLLAVRDTLRLSPAQVKRLEDIERTMRPAQAAREVLNPAQLREVESMAGRWAGHGMGCGSGAGGGGAAAHQH